MSDFLPSEYEVPASNSGYMKFEQGENRFRIMSSPILGWEYWTDDNGKRKPNRRKMTDPRPDSITDPTEYVHFWAMIVWNYKVERIQILEIKQSSIQRTLRALAKDADWGSPVQSYDLVVTRTGEKLDSKYQVLPKPAKKLDPGIVQLYEDMEIDLDQLYVGGDPFKAKDERLVEEVFKVTK